MSWASSTYSLHIQTYSELNEIGLIHYRQLSQDQLKSLLNVIDRSSVPKHYSFILKDKQNLIKKVENLIKKV
jgi:hypothetical protein